MRKIFIAQKSIHLDPGQLIQSGGEGMVFNLGQSAVKIYHHPTAARQAKLEWLLRNAGRFPDNTFGPCRLVHNEKNEVAGFEMKLLPAGSQPLKQFSRPGFRQTADLQTPQIISLFEDIRQTLNRLHQANIVVGDLNEHNVFWLISPTQNTPLSFWIDVDSYQFGGYPCPVAMQPFLDPRLYDIADFSRQPAFDALSDWYAFGVLLVKSLLQVHPYGGVHHQHKSLAARARAQVSILSPEVIYPRRAQPLESLSDDLLHQIHQIYETGQRLPFPADLLQQYLLSLITCRQCGLTYPRQRPGCPACRQQTPALKPIISRGKLLVRQLIDEDGIIVQVNVLPTGRILAITCSGSDYRLIRAGAGGQYQQQPLFSGQAGYRFALFDSRYLVVNPPESRQLLILDVDQQPPQQVDLVETAVFRGQAVFATTAKHLIRVVQGQVLRGTVRYGSLLDETIATARRHQSWLWASPFDETVAGFYRFFDSTHFFIVNDQGGNYDVPIPLTVGESLIESQALFGPEKVVFVLKIIKKGQVYQRLFFVNQQGQIITRREFDVEPGGHYESVQGPALFESTLLYPANGGVIKENQHGQTCLADTADFVASGDQLHYHPAGLLIQQNSQLFLATENR